MGVGTEHGGGEEEGEGDTRVSERVTEQMVVSLSETGVPGGGAGWTGGGGQRGQPPTVQVQRPASTQHGDLQV